MVIEILTAILVFITAIYAYLTHRMAKSSEASVEAMRNQSEASLRPYITVAPFIRAHTPMLYLRVKNTGITGAQNVRLSIDRDFYKFARPDGNLRALSAFTTPIDSLSPGAELIFGLAQGWVLFGEKSQPDICPTQFNVTSEYEFFGKTVQEVTQVDLRPYLGSEGERDPIVEELERIRKVLEEKK
jgi:hypothetical protein